MTDYMINVNDLSETTKENSQHVFTLSDGKMKRVPIEEFSGGGITADVIFNLTIPMDDPEAFEGEVVLRDGLDYDGLNQMIDAGISPVYGGGIHMVTEDESGNVVSVVAMPASVTNFELLGGITFFFTTMPISDEMYAIAIDSDMNVSVMTLGS